MRQIQVGESSRVSGGLDDMSYPIFAEYGTFGDGSWGGAWGGESLYSFDTYTVWGDASGGGFTSLNSFGAAGEMILLGAAIGSGGTAATWTAVAGVGFTFAQSAGSFNSVAGDGRYGVQYGLGYMGDVWAP